MVEIENRKFSKIKISQENQDACNFVGTRQQSGFCQLTILMHEGLKPHNTIFEIGCGALVASIPIIEYLDKNKYCGTDPNEWLRNDTLMIENNRNILKKNPTFYSNDDFRPSNKRKFDFIFAHSIFNHAANWQFELFLDNIKKHMKKDTIIIISLLFAEGNKYGNPGYGVWPDEIAPINSDKWMSQEVIYVNNKPRGDKKGKVNFKTKEFVFNSCKKRKMKCEIIDKYTELYTLHEYNYHDWIRITKEN